MSLSLNITANGNDALIKLTPPDGTKRSPCDICCVVDTSGSMDTIATLKTATGDTESHGLSLLDIVKHAVRTIINNLNENDRLCLVSFSTKAKVELKLTSMTKDNQKNAEAVLDALHTNGCTNIWDGLHTGLELLRSVPEETKKNRISTVFLLTDGLPNEIPQLGHMPMLQRYKDQYGLGCTINTFGFGYSLDSPLLNDLAVAGNGTYCFIPDSGLVGTVFIHALSNFLATFATNVTITVEPEEGSIKKVHAHSEEKASWGSKVNLGSIRFGQSKSAVVSLETIASGGYLHAAVTYNTPATGNEEIKIELDADDTSSNQDEVLINKFRLQSVAVVRKAMQKEKNRNGSGLPKLQSFIAKVKQSSVANDAYVADLLKDLEGQISEAFSKSSYYNKWGKHYLPSIIAAHLNQQCNNFKDPGVQHYGGTLFGQLRDEADDVFTSLPAPKPSVKANSYYSSSAATNYSSLSSMSSYNCASAPCFTGSCNVAMADGTTKQVQQLQKGDAVFTPNGTGIASITCVVKTDCSNQHTELVNLDSGLQVTPYHPIRINDVWHFPNEFGATSKAKVDAVYSFLLNQNHIMQIEGTECVTFAHHFEDNDVIKHPYFGTELIVNDLKQLPGFDDGLVVLQAGCCTKDPQTGLVCSILPQ